MQRKDWYYFSFLGISVNPAMYAVEKYVDALYDMEALHTKKAFFKGCRFSVSFLIQTDI